jgi:hypothetical protein
MLVPKDAVLYFEGTSISKTIKAYLQGRAISPRYELSKGTIWPKSAVFHVPLTSDFMEGLAKLADSHAEPEICDHIQAYSGDAIVFTWFDAFHDPLFLTPDTPESIVHEYCIKMNARCTLISPAG